MKKALLSMILATICSLAVADISITNLFDNIAGNTTISQIKDAMFGAGNSVSIGAGSSANANQAVAYGKQANAAGQSSTAIGPYATTVHLSSVAIGAGSEASGTYAIAQGLNAKTTGSSSIAIGSNTSSSNGGVSLGGSAKAGTSGVAIGQSAQSTNSLGIAIGRGAQANGTQSIAIGRDAKANYVACAAIGPSAEAPGDGKMRVQFSPDDIFIGFFTSKSLTTWITELAPGPDETVIRNIAKSELANAKFFPTEDYYTSGVTTTQVFKTTRTISGPMYRTSPYTAEYLIEGLTGLDSLDRHGEYWLTFGANTVLGFEDTAKVNFYNATFWGMGNSNDIFIQNPTNVRFFGAAALPERSKSLIQLIKDVSAENSARSPSVQAVGQPLDLSNGVLCTDGKTVIYPHADGTWSTEK